MIEAENLTKDFLISGSDTPFKAVDSLTFKIEKGEVVGLLGPNGAGKTT
ncbi:MAG: ATP-binding cassette domain-containing protein, partial [Planctomycetota bacterium]|nr:ATP-binding cassette domain-containing protein [Planctomycetota bacterium]